MERMTKIIQWSKLHFAADDLFILYHPQYDLSAFTKTIMFLEIVFQTCLYYTEYSSRIPIAYMINITAILTDSPYMNLVFIYTIAVSFSNIMYMSHSRHRLYVKKMLHSYFVSSNAITTILETNFEGLMRDCKRFFMVSKQFLSSVLFVIAYIFYKLFSVDLPLPTMLFATAHGVCLTSLWFLSFDHMLQCFMLFFIYLFGTKKILETVNIRLGEIVVQNHNMPHFRSRCYKKFSLIWKCFNIFLAQFMRANKLFNYWTLKRILYFAFIHTYLSTLLMFQDTVNDNLSFTICLSSILVELSLMISFHYFIARLPHLVQEPVKHCYSVLSKSSKISYGKVIQLELSLIMLNSRKELSVGLLYGNFGLISVSAFSKFLLFYSKVAMKCYKMQQNASLASLN